MEELRERGASEADEGGDAPGLTLAASFSASGTRQPQASGPPGLSGEYKGGDVPEPMVDTALHRFPPHVCDQRLSEHRSAPVVLL